MAWHDLVKENICKRHERLKQVIGTRTDLPPAMFFALFTIVAATAAASIAILSSFISPPTHVDPDKKPGDRDPDDTEIFPEPVQVGEVSEDELMMYDGSDPEKPILTAIKGQVYDVSKSRFVYLDP
jgi:membrane-associated progesterone receptor component